MDLVIVESPAKAKTINRYLGADFHVLASYGHVRDLPAKDGSVRPDEDFSMSWTVDDRAEKRLKEIAQASKTADTVYLATDPDREGEAISWHIVEELSRRKSMPGDSVKRVVFNEVTKNAVVDAFKHPRDLNQALIQAYLARRALDYLVGFTLSPVLWRKLPGSRSAGRVQSVALRLICEREAEIEVFRPQEFWTIDVALKTRNDAEFSARLTHLDGTKLDKFALGDEAAARAAAERLETASSFAVKSIERKQTRRNPYPPFTTSTLQQDASSKLGFGTTRTMRLAQNLYEGVDLGGETVGLITYMRTDGVQMATEAIEATREMIVGDYGDRYLPSSPRIYKTKAKNAQEAHEAIRPTDLRRRPKDLQGKLEPDAFKLYSLIWKRTMASQMESVVLDQVAVEIAVDDSRATLRATGSTIVFDGFLAVYQQGRDDKAEAADDQERRLPKLEEREPLSREKVLPEQHFTQPPPRYTEASLVKKMEELGIGRPSTYASIIQVLQDRNYVRLEKRRFEPEDRGRLVIAFLTEFFKRYVEYDFTADLEMQLDQISDGAVDWKDVLKDFWTAFAAAIDNTKDLKISNVIDALDEALGDHFFPLDPEAPDYNPRACRACEGGRLGLKLARNGGFIGCSNYPECRYTRPLAVALNGAEAAAEQIGPKLLGQDPASGQDVQLKIGPFGPYVQLGEGAEGEKPKRSSLPKDQAPDQVTLEIALALLALPREVGPHPEGGEMITAGLGRYGPYIKHGRTYCSLKDGDDVLTIGLNRAVTLLAEAPQRRQAAPGKALGDHPEDGKPVTLHEGRYGPYVKHGKVNATLPKDITPDTVTLDQAIGLIQAKAAKPSTKRGRKGSSKKSSAKGTKRSSKGTKAKATKKAPSSKAKKTTGGKAAKKAAGSGAATDAAAK